MLHHKSLCNNALSLIGILNKFSVQTHDWNPNSISIEKKFKTETNLFRIRFWWNLILSFGKIKSISRFPDFPMPHFLRQKPPKRSLIISSFYFCNAMKYCFIKSKEALIPFILFEWIYLFPRLRNIYIRCCLLLLEDHYR